MGRLIKEPELRYTTGNNTAVCSFTLAVDKRFKKQSDTDKVDFINCQAWQKTAEFIGKYFQKGRQVAVIGRIETSSWDGTDGKKHYKTEVVVDEAYFADSKRDDGLSNNHSQNNSFAPVDDDDELPF